MATNTVPDIFGRLQRRHGELMAAAEAVGQAARRAGPLDERQIQLIQLAAAAAIRSEGAVFLRRSRRRPETTTACAGRGLQRQAHLPRPGLGVAPSGVDFVTAAGGRTAGRPPRSYATT